MSIKHIKCLIFFKIGCVSCITLFGVRDLHTRISTQKANNEIKNSLKIDPYYVTGFTDGEGCFSILFRRNNKMKLG